MSTLSGNSINVRGRCTLWPTLTLSFKIIIWTADAVAIVFTAGRLFIRCRFTKKIHWDDAVHVLAMLCMIIQSAIYSGGQSLEESVQAHLAKQTHVVPNLRLFLQLNIASTIITFTCYWAVKLSIMLFYRTLFWVYETFMKAWWIVLSFVIATRKLIFFFETGKNNCRVTMLLCFLQWRYEHNLGMNIKMTRKCLFPSPRLSSLNILS